MKHRALNMGVAAGAVGADCSEATFTLCAPSETHHLLMTMSVVSALCTPPHTHTRARRRQDTRRWR